MRYKGEVEEAASESKDEQIRQMLQGADNKLVGEVKDRYYGVADNFSTFVRKLNSLNGETGEFSADLKNAKMALKWFEKLTIGKYL